MKYLNNLFLLFALFGSHTYAQTDLRKTESIINTSVLHTKLSNVAYFERNEILLKDFKGIPVILDFFSLGCSSCFASFPKLNTLSKSYKDRIQFILVGQDGKKTGDLLRKSYNKYQKIYNLDFPVAFDSTLFTYFKINSVPFVAWIDRNGDVKHVTSSSEVNDENILRFLAGKEILSMNYGASNTTHIAFNPDKPFLVNNNGGYDTSFIQRSLFAKWLPGSPRYSNADFEICKKYNSVPDQLLITGPLTQMYRVAYFGKLLDWQYNDTAFYGKRCYSPILEVDDVSPFKADRNTGSGYFTYSQILPKYKRSCQNMQEVMKLDLRNFLGYDVSIESRMMPCLKLVASDRAKVALKTKGEKGSRVESFAGLEYVNIPIDVMIGKIVYDNYLVSNDMPIINETGIIGNIDIKLDAAMTDLKSVKEGLKQNGLDLVKGEKLMQVIVIRDLLKK